MSSNAFCLSGLIEKRAELAGEIRLLEERLEQLRSNVLHVDATLLHGSPRVAPSDRVT